MEFVWLGIILLVPLVWIVLSVFEVQRGAFAVSSAARSAARAFALADSDAAGEADARAAIRQALDDQGGDDRAFRFDIRCGGGDCHRTGEVITVQVWTRVDLPLLPGDPRRRRPELRARLDPHRARRPVPGPLMQGHVETSAAR